MISREDRDWWPVWVMGSAAALLLVIAMIFALVTSVQARNEAVDRNDRDTEQIECRAAFNAAITAAEQRADSSEHDLFAEIVRGVVSENPNSDLLVEMANRVNHQNEHTTALIADLEQYIAAGSPLPCPLEIE